jgi:hypothetical protein
MPLEGTRLVSLTRREKRPENCVTTFTKYRSIRQTVKRFGEPVPLMFITSPKWGRCDHTLSHSISSALGCNHEGVHGRVLSPGEERTSSTLEENGIALAISCKWSVYILGAQLWRAYRQDDCRMQAERDVPLKCLLRLNGV